MKHVWEAISHGRGIINGTKVNLGISTNCFRIGTYSRKHGHSPHRLLIGREAFQRWLDSGTGEFCDSDIWSFVKATKAGGIVHLVLSWLSASDDRLSGFIEHIEIPESVFWELLTHDDHDLTLLYNPAWRSPRFDFSAADIRLRECLADSSMRRALSKFLRDINWKDTTFRVSNDFCKGSFFFQADRISGGMILHQGSTDTRIGKLSKVYYGMHT